MSHAREVPAVLGRLHGVRSRGAGWSARCPSHPDTEPSLSVDIGSEGRVLLHCFAGCSVEAVLDALHLQSQDLSGDRDIALPRVARRPFARPEPLRPNREEVERMRRTVDQAAAVLRDADEQHPALQYAWRRFGLNVTAVRRLGLGYAGGRLVVPFRNPGRVVGGYQGRAIGAESHSRWKSPQGRWARCAWLTSTEGDAPVVVTEGPSDGLAAVALGFNAVAVRGAALATDLRVQDTVRRWTAGASAVLLAGDGDDAGRRFSSTLLQALQDREVPVIVLSIPDGRDLADLRARDHDRTKGWIGEHLQRATVEVV